MLPVRNLHSRFLSGFFMMLPLMLPSSAEYGQIYLCDCMSGPEEVQTLGYNKTYYIWWKFWIVWKRTKSIRREFIILEQARNLSDGTVSTSWDITSPGNEPCLRLPPDMRGYFQIAAQVRRLSNAQGSAGTDAAWKRKRSGSAKDFLHPYRTTYVMWACAQASQHVTTEPATNCEPRHACFCYQRTYHMQIRKKSNRNASERRNTITKKHQILLAKPTPQVWVNEG